MPPGPAPAAPPQPGGLRIAYLVYRGNPRCGGQGVYTRHLARELVNLGHSVEVFAGQPWPVLDDGVGFTPVPGPRPLPRSRPLPVCPIPPRVPLLDGPGRIRGHVHGRVPRAAHLLDQGTATAAPRRADFDLVHDNQCLGSGLLGMMDDGWPLLTTLHHPITVDRVLALSHAENAYRRLTQRRWFGFLGMQMRVARQLPGS